MFYNSLKIIHILSAAGLLTAIALSVRCWYLSKNSLSTLKFIQIQTALAIIPLALFQLISGFTMISLQHYDLSELWIKGSMTGFIMLVISWMGFVYLQFQAQRFQRLQVTLLSVCLLSLLMMIFFMANKII